MKNLKVTVLGMAVSTMLFGAGFLFFGQPSLPKSTSLKIASLDSVTESSASATAVGTKALSQSPSSPPVADNSSKGAEPPVREGVEEASADTVRLFQAMEDDLKRHRGPIVVGVIDDQPQVDVDDVEIRKEADQGPVGSETGALLENLDLGPKEKLGDRMIEVSLD